MSTSVKAAAVQISPVLYSRRGTVEKVVQKIRELGEKGVQYAAFAETLVPYYPYFSFVQSALELMTGSVAMIALLLMFGVWAEKLRETQGRLKAAKQTIRSR